MRSRNAPTVSTCVRALSSCIRAMIGVGLRGGMIGWVESALAAERKGYRRLYSREKVECGYWQDSGIRGVEKAWINVEQLFLSGIEACTLQRSRRPTDTPATSVSLHLRPLSSCARPSPLPSPAHDYSSHGCSQARPENSSGLGSGARISSFPRVMTFSRLSWKKLFTKPFEINGHGCGVDGHGRCNSNFCDSLHRSRPPPC